MTRMAARLVNGLYVSLACNLIADLSWSEIIKGERERGTTENDDAWAWAAPRRRSRICTNVGNMCGDCNLYHHHHHHHCLIRSRSNIHECVAPWKLLEWLHEDTKIRSTNENKKVKKKRRNVGRKTSTTGKNSISNRGYRENSRKSVERRRWRRRPVSHKAS